MRWILSIFSISLLFVITLAPASANITYQNFLNCLPPYTGSDSDISTCRDLGRVKDSNGNSIPGAEFHAIIVNDGAGSKLDYRVSLSSSGLYGFCSYLKTSIGNPKVDKIYAVAPGYDKSEEYSTQPTNACNDNNTDEKFGDFVLNQATNQYGCFAGSDGGGSCTNMRDNPGGTPAELFNGDSDGEASAACSEACGRWRVVQGADGGVAEICQKEENITGTVLVSTTLYPTKNLCDQARTGGGLDFEPTVVDGTGITPTPTPDPTPEPPRPPCRSPHVTTDGAFIGCETVSTGLGIGLSTDPASFIKSIFTLLLSISGGIAILLIMRAGYKFMTSQGDPERVKEAREVLTSAVIGLLFIIFSLVILEVIGVDILRIPGFSR